MSIEQRIARGMTAAVCLWLAAASRRVRAGRAAADPHRQHAGADRARWRRPALVHKVVGEIYVEQLNKRGGLLGRPVEWIVKDDQSKPDLARTLYEQLITADKVDLLMGPYATGAILSAMGVAQRYNKVLVHHTFGIPSLAKYDMQFPAWSLGPEPATTVAEHGVRRARRVARSRRRRSPSSPASSRRSTSCRSARARSLKKRGLQRSAVPRMGLRQPRLRPDRQRASRTPSPTSSGSARSASTATSCSTR